MKKLFVVPAIVSSVFFSGCTSTFAGTLFVLSFRDLILYVVLAFVFAALIALKSSEEKRKAAFWIWFVLGILLTPLSGFIYLLVKLTKKYS